MVGGCSVDTAAQIGTNTPGEGQGATQSLASCIQGTAATCHFQALSASWALLELGAQPGPLWAQEGSQ